MADRIGTALRAVVTNEAIPRLASMVIAEIREDLRPWVLPVRDRREIAYVFERGLLGLYQEMVRRGEIVRALPSDLMALLERGHYDFADWAMLKSPPSSGEFLRYVFKEEGSIFRFSPDMRMVRWIENNFEVGRVLVDLDAADESDGELTWEDSANALDKYLNTANFDPQVADWFAGYIGYEFCSESTLWELFDGEKFTPRAVAWLVAEGYIPANKATAREPLYGDVEGSFTTFVAGVLSNTLEEMLEKGDPAAEALYARDGRVVDILRIIGILYDAEDLEPGDLMRAITSATSTRALGEIFPDENSRRRLVARILALRERAQ